MSSQVFFVRISMKALRNGSQSFVRFRSSMPDSALTAKEQRASLFRNNSLACDVAFHGRTGRQGSASLSRPLSSTPKHDYTHEINKAGYRRPLSYEEQVKKGVPFGKRRLNQHQSQMAVQVVVGMTMLVGLVLSPFLGRKLATDPPDWLPKWYDFRVEQEKGMTREEFQDMFIEMQQELHKRAIEGEFHPDKLDRIDWSKEDHSGANRRSEVSSANARMQRDLEESLARRHGWDKIQPLDDDNEEEFEEVEIEVEVDENGKEIQIARGVALEVHTKEGETATPGTAELAVVDAASLESAEKKDGPKKKTK